MLEVVGVRFKKAGKIFYFDPGGLALQAGQSVIVDTIRGQELGHVAMRERSVREEDVVLPLKKVIRVADSCDMQVAARNKADALAALTMNIDKFRALNMKLVDAEWTFDRSKIFFYYTAEERIDFRELVKCLVRIFKTRVELRHIGVRDEAKLLGGLGPCGRVLCCSSFLGELEPVSIKMAKDQKLALNPAKLSGLCGKLMCCLRFELDTYERSKETAPRIGQTVLTPGGPANVIGFSETTHSIRVKLTENEQTRQFDLDDPSIQW